MQSLIYSQTSEADSLKNKIKNNSKEDSVLVDRYTRIALLLLDNRQMNEAENYAKKAKDISTKINYRKGYLNSINALAACYSDVGNYARSITLYEEYISVCIKNNIEEGVMGGYNNLGLTFQYAGNNKEALDYFFKALTIAEKNKDKYQKKIAMYYTNISLVYAAYNNYEKAIEYIELAIEMARRLKGQEKSVITRVINLSTYYREFKQPQKAVSLLLETIKLNDSTIKNTVYDAYMRNNLAQSYSDQGQYVKAVSEYVKANKVFKEIGDLKNATQVNINLALAHSGAGHSDLAIKFLTQGLDAIDKLNDNELKRYSYSVASIIYGKNKDYKRALDFANKSSTLKDSLLNEKQAAFIADMQTKYGTKQKQDSLRLQKAELDNQTALNKQIEYSSRQKTLLLFISVGGLVILSFLVVFAFTNYRKKQKANILLNEQKRIIEQKNSENELLLGEIHHRVKNNLQVISSLLSLQEKNAGNENIRMAIVEGKERIRSMELVHKMLYRENSFSGIEMQEYVKGLVGGLFDSYGMDSDRGELRADFSPFTLDVDFAIPLGLILNEMVTNSLKYAAGNNHHKLILTINMQRNGNQLTVSYSDNGKGKKEDIESSASFGYKIITSLTRQLNGKLSITDDGGLHYLLIFKCEQT